MAIDLTDGNTSRHYTIVDHADLDFPDGDWSFGIWTRVDDNTGSQHQYIASNNNYQVTNSFNLTLREASLSSPNAWFLQVQDSNGSPNQHEFVGTSTPGADSVNRLVVVVRTGGGSGACTITLWICDEFGSASNEGSFTDNTFNDIAGGTFYIGQRADGDDDRSYEEHLGGVFKGNFALAQADIEAIAAGQMPWAFGTLDFYLPFFAPDATVFDVIGSHDATQVGSSWAAASAHFPVQSGPADGSGRGVGRGVMRGVG